VGRSAQPIAQRAAAAGVELSDATAATVAAFVEQLDAAAARLSELDGIDGPPAPAFDPRWR